MNILDIAVKYKNIRSMAHNWSHSFMSYMNYVDDGYVCDELYAIAREKRGEKVVIHWIPSAQDQHAPFSKRVEKSIGFYRDQLAAHLKAHNVEAAAIGEFRTEVFVGEGFRMYVRAYVLDDRGKEHEAFVWA